MTLPQGLLIQKRQMPVDLSAVRSDRVLIAISLSFPPYALSSFEGAVCFRYRNA